MSLAPGTSLGPYQIVAPLGEGGMGEVYRANDTRLDRIVALKVSKTNFDERFEREARAVAAVSHPHICALYDVGPNYLVMELVEGVPLAGPLPVEQAVTYAAQILDALDAAHGNRAFDGASPASVIATCLAKDPDERFQTALDTRRAMRWAMEQPAASAVTSAPGSRRRERVWMGVAAVAIASVLGIAGWLIITRPAPSAELRTEIVTPGSNDAASFALSPDGTRIAYTTVTDGVARLWVRSLNSGVAQPVPGTEGAADPFWSPDGLSLGFFGPGKLFRVDLAGGAPQSLTDATSSQGGATWNVRGVILFQDARLGLAMMPASGGTPSTVTRTGKGEYRHHSPRFLPDGIHFLFHTSGADNAIYLGTLDGGAPQRVTEADSVGEYLPSGWLLWVHRSALLARRFDPVDGALSGAPLTLAQPVDVNSLAGNGMFSVSASGLLAWRTGLSSRTQLVWYSRGGERLGALAEPESGYINNPSLSPDGRRVAATLNVPGKGGDIGLLDGTRSTRFTFDDADDRFSTWSPDGNRVIFTSNRNGPGDLYIRPADGSAPEKLLLASPERKFATAWSSDGKWLLYESLGIGSRDLMVLPLEGEPTPRVLLATPFNETAATFSPDGKWVAYASDESGRRETYVRPFPGPGGVWQVSTGAGGAARWKADGTELYYLAPSGLVAVPIAAQGKTITAGPPQALFNPNMQDGGGTRQWDVSPDGRFLVTVKVAGPTTPITLVQNWHPPK